jgi:MFS transporter, FSR family, fosmidomycin resistance protein
MKKDAATIGLVALAHAMSHFFQLVFPPLLPLLRAELDVSYSTLGMVVVLFFAASALLQPFAGFLVDRVGGREVLLGGVALMVAGMTVMSSANGVAVLALGALLTGVGNCVFHPADMSILNARVSRPRLGHAFSAHGMSGFLGFAAAPVFSATLSSAFGWRAALGGAAVVGLVVLAMLAVNARHLAAEQPARRMQAALGQDVRVLISPPVLLCFLFFLISGCTYAGISQFSITAMQLQYGVASTFASVALTSYMLGNVGGMLAGGFVASRTARHDLVAGAGLLCSALVMLAVAAGAMPGAALPLALAAAGVAAGIMYPSRDMIVRGATPPGAAGRVYGFVYSGLDFGVVATPVFYGMMIDGGMPQGVFYAIFGFTLIGILTVLQVPGRRLATNSGSGS